jgi:hypothetical protein
MGVLDRGYTAHGPAHLWNLLVIDPLVICVYVQQTFLPWHLKVLYTWPEILTTYPLWQVATSIALVIMAGGLGVCLFRRHKDLFFYYASFFVIMVPYMNLVFSGIYVAERYLYFSVFGLLALALSMVASILQRTQSVWRGGAFVGGACFVILNLFQTFSYQPAWRNGETLWQYHLTLPQPSPMSYANLAAYYYADATAKVGTPQMAMPMSKMSVVVDAGLAKFWPDHRQPPPPDIYFLFFLKSIVQEVSGEPEAALASLLTSDNLHPKFDSTSLNLARLYRKLSKAAADPRQRAVYAHDAQNRFAEYMALAFRGRPAPPDVQKEFADIKAESSALPQPIGKQSAE